MANNTANIFQRYSCLILFKKLKKTLCIFIYDNFYFHLGEFIGGCDILMEMHRSGDIVEELEKIGIKSIAPNKQ